MDIVGVSCTSASCSGCFLGNLATLVVDQPYPTFAQCIQRVYKTTYWLTDNSYLTTSGPEDRDADAVRRWLRISLWDGGLQESVTTIHRDIGDVTTTIRRIDPLSARSQNWQNPLGYSYNKTTSSRATSGECTRLLALWSEDSLRPRQAWLVLHQHRLQTGRDSHRGIFSRAVKQAANVQRQQWPMSCPQQQDLLSNLLIVLLQMNISSVI